LSLAHMQTTTHNHMLHTNNKLNHSPSVNAAPEFKSPLTWSDFSNKTTTITTSQPTQPMVEHAKENHPPSISVTKLNHTTINTTLRLLKWNHQTNYSVTTSNFIHFSIFVFLELWGFCVKHWWAVRGSC
jgi:hypothetical protein